MAQNIDINKTVEAWADIVIKNWRRKITELDIGVTGNLFDSFQFEIIGQSGLNPERINFAYEYYGRFVDMGVGREMSIGNPGDVKTRRKPKKWYSPVIYAQVKKLAEILSEKYSIIGAGIISEKINGYERKSGKKRKKDLSQLPAYRELTDLDREWMRRNGMPID